MLMISTLFDITKESEGYTNQFLESLRLKDLLYDDSMTSQEYSPGSLNLTQVNLILYIISL